MTTRRTTFTRTPFVITAFLAANLAVTGAPLVAMAEEGAPQENPPAAEQQPEQAPDQLQTQQAPEPNLETQADPHYTLADGVLTITGNLDDDDFEGGYPKWHAEADKITEVKIEKKVTATTFENLFADCNKLTSLDLTNLELVNADTAKTTNMFNGCEKLEELKLPKDFRFKKDQDPKIPDPAGELKWSNNTEAKSSSELFTLYVAEDSTKAPTADYTWKWQKQVEVTVTTATPDDVVYNGEAHKPTPAVTVTAGEQELTASDYTLKGYTYDPSDPKHAGKVTVTPDVVDAHDGKGYLIWNPTTTTAAEFTIAQRPVHVTAKDVTMVYDGYKTDGALTPLKVSMTYASGDIIEADKDKVALKAGYTCEWKREVGEYDIKVGDVKFEDKDSSSSSSTSLATSADDTSVAANYVAGEKTNGKLKVTAADISNATVSAVSDRTYTGSAITPTPTVVMTYSYTEGGTTKSGSTQLTKDTDYTLSYANNTQVGQATITIKGKGNFTGTKTVNFNIKSASSTSGSSTTSSTTSSTSATPSTADPTSVAGIGSLLASGIAALGAARFTRKRKN